MNKKGKVFIAGHRGLVGSALMRRFKDEKYEIVTRSSSELDLRNQASVHEFFQTEKPNYVFLSAAKVGGILANQSYPAEFIYNNLMIAANVIEASYRHEVQKLLFFGSSCIYPKYAEQPIKEDYLLRGELEPTNEPYAISKIAGLKMCEAYNRQFQTDFISLMPTNLYGQNDNFDLKNSHVLPALIRKFHEAKLNHEPEVEVWGTGRPKREFLYVDDLADAAVFILENYSASEIGGWVNVGTGQDLSIGELAYLIKEIVGFKGEIKYNLSKPDGTPRKLLDVTKINQLGWRAATSLEEGIKKTYKWYLEEQKY